MIPNIVSKDFLEMLNHLYKHQKLYFLFLIQINEKKNSTQNIN